jgi:hypothetical protein
VSFRLAADARCASPCGASEIDSAASVDIENNQLLTMCVITAPNCFLNRVYDFMTLFPFVIGRLTSYRSSN